MKKLIALLAALTMLFVCGCGSNSKDNGTDNGNGTNNGTGEAAEYGEWYECSGRESVKQKRHGVSCAVSFVFLHRFTGAHELRQQYALSGRQFFSLNLSRGIRRLRTAGTCADAARAHKRDGHQGFHPSYESPRFLLARRNLQS